MHTLLHDISLYQRLIFRTKSAFLAFTVIAALCGPLSRAHATALTASGPIVINGQNGTVVSGLRITSTSVDCVRIINSTHITIMDSEIGPCGTNRTTGPSNGVHITGGSAINVYDNYIHVENLASGCCDTHDGILIDTNTSGVMIQGNVIAYNEANIEALQGTSQITVLGNFLLNPRGPFPRGVQFQSAYASNITVNNNYSLSSTDTSKYLYPEQQSDAINFYFTNTFTAANNYVTGGHSSSGCGIIVDEASNYGTFSSNLVYNSGQCGLSVADGVGHRIDGNKILNLSPVPGGGNTAMSVWKQYSAACGGNGPPNQIVISNNVADEVQLSGYHSGFWNGGGCGTLNMANNTFGNAANAILYPWSHQPPLIPPQPFSCVISSPYSTQTSKPGCNGGPPPPPPPPCGP